jgi:hypothetical protein
MKLLLPLEAMTAPIPLPGPFIRFLGVAEGLGAIGLTRHGGSLCGFEVQLVF